MRCCLVPNAFLAVATSLGSAERGSRNGAAVASAVLEAREQRPILPPGQKGVLVLFVLCLLVLLTGCLPPGVLPAPTSTVNLVRAQLTAQLLLADDQLREAGVATRPLNIDFEGPTAFEVVAPPTWQRLPNLLIADGIVPFALRVQCRPSPSGEVLCKRLTPSAQHLTTPTTTQPGALK